MDELTYDDVLTSVYALLGKQEGRDGQNATFLKTCWLLGRHILDVEGQVWGRQLVKRLSVDLTGKFGDGFSTSNLFSMRKFALLYGRDEYESDVRWSMYRVLVTVADPRERAELTRQVREAGLSCRDLAVAASKLKFVKDKSADWSVRAGRTGLYRYELRPDGRPVLDGGFGLKFDPTIVGIESLNSCTPGTIIKIEGSHAVALEGVGESYRHCYEGSVVRVIDGDTVLLSLDRAPGVYADIRVRLRGIDAVELSSAKGMEAKEFLYCKLAVGQRVVTLTHGLDTHGRWLGDVFTTLHDALWSDGPLAWVHVNRIVGESGLAGIQVRMW